MWRYIFLPPGSYRTVFANRHSRQHVNIATNPYIIAYRYRMRIFQSLVSLHGINRMTQ